jgi:flagellar biosynthetic protein FliR
MEQVFLFLPTILLMFCRIASFFVVVPVFSSRNVPMPFKIGLAASVTFLTFAVTGTKTPIAMDAEYILYIFREVIVGLLLGFLAYMFFTVVQIAGSFMDIQIGFGIANIIDPMTGASSPMVGNFKYMLAMMLFLAFDGHHYFLQAILESYKWIPLTNELFAKIYKGEVSNFVLTSFSTMFTLAFQLAVPIIAAMFLTDLGLGLLTRVAPQFNIFVIGVPIKIIIGLLMLLALLPELSSLFRSLFDSMFLSIRKLMELIQSP